MKKILVVQTIDMNVENKMQAYFDKTLEMIKEKKYDLEVINLPVRYDSDTILEQIVALKLINIAEDVQLIIAIGDLAGLVGENKKILLYEKDFIGRFEEKIKGYLGRVVCDVKERSEHSHCIEDTKLEKWSSIIEGIIEEAE